MEQAGRAAHDNDLFQVLCTSYRFGNGLAKAPLRRRERERRRRRGCQGKSRRNRKTRWPSGVLAGLLIVTTRRLMVEDRKGVNIKYCTVLAGLPSCFDLYGVARNKSVHCVSHSIPTPSLVAARLSKP